MQIYGRTVLAMVTATQGDVVNAWWDELEKLAKTLVRVGPDDVCCEGLTPRQTAILRTLTEREGARIGDLAAAVELSPSAMTRVVEKLEAQGLVERVRGVGDDGRAAMVKITDAGREVRKRIDHLMQERTLAIVNAVPEEKRAVVLWAVRLLNEAMSSEGCCGLNCPS
jgi:DNA-binding MarR family transcriptional regulator